MTVTSERQFCAVCAWRENCAKKFCVTDGGARCPDFTRDIFLKSAESPDPAAPEAPAEKP